MGTSFTTNPGKNQKKKECGGWVCGGGGALGGRWRLPPLFELSIMSKKSPPPKNKKCLLEKPCLYVELEPKEKKDLPQKRERVK